MGDGEKAFLAIALAVALAFSVCYWKSCDHEAEMAKLGYEQSCTGRATVWVKSHLVKAEESK